MLRINDNCKSLWSHSWGTKRVYIGKVVKERELWVVRMVQSTEKDETPCARRGVSEILRLMCGCLRETGSCANFSFHWCELSSFSASAFSDLTLLVGRQEGHPACKKQWWGAGMVICLERGADLHTAQLVPLPLTVSCFSKIQIGFIFLVPAHPGSLGKKGR